MGFGGEDYSKKYLRQKPFLALRKLKMDLYLQALKACNDNSDEIYSSEDPGFDASA